MPGEPPSPRHGGARRFGQVCVVPPDRDGCSRSSSQYDSQIGKLTMCLVVVEAVADYKFVPDPEPDQVYRNGRPTARRLVQ